MGKPAQNSCGSGGRVILIIRDGWGHKEDSKLNAIYESAPLIDASMIRDYPSCLISAAGEAVGLPEGYQGNSEVGHMTIGSGRINFQSLERINKSVREKEFFRIKEFCEAIDNCRREGSRLHLIGLLQTEGVHSHRDHLFALLDLCRMQGLSDVCVHVITDGRDSPPTDSVKHVSALSQKLADIGFGSIATVCGRYYAMDRDQRWERTKAAYDCIVNAESDEEFDDALSLIQECHANNETDEFIRPRKACGYGGVKDGDSIIFYNFRTDRPRQFTQAVIEDEFCGWKRKPKDVHYVAMTQFYTPMKASVAFKDQSYSNLLGEVVSRAGLSQLRISETEKYAHVTFFFNCQAEQPYQGEERILIQSPKVATYDLAPQMSVRGISERLVSEIRRGRHDLIVTNLVNCDMVGHTGVPEAIRRAVACVDECVGDIVNAGLDEGYTLLITADHGNAEDQSPQVITSHTMNPVRLIVVSEDERLRHAKLRDGAGLADIAPTVLDIMGIEKPKEMSGKSVIL